MLDDEVIAFVARGTVRVPGAEHGAQRALGPSQRGPGAVQPEGRPRFSKSRHAARSRSKNWSSRRSPTPEIPTAAPEKTGALGRPAAERYEDPRLLDRHLRFF